MLLRPRSLLRCYSPFNTFSIDYANVVDVHLIFEQLRTKSSLVRRTLKSLRPTEVELNTTSIVKTIAGLAGIPLPELNVKWTPSVAEKISALSLNPAQEHLLFTKTRDMEKWCLERGHYRLNVAYDQRAAISDVSVLKLEMPTELAKPITADRIEHGTMLVTDSAIFMDQVGTEIKLYIADYPTPPPRPKSDRIISLDVRPAVAEKIAKFLEKYSGWYPYARIFGQYLSLDSDNPRLLLVSISFRYLELAELNKLTNVIDESEIHSLLVDLYAVDVSREEFMTKYYIYQEMADISLKNEGPEAAKNYIERENYRIRSDNLENFAVRRSEEFEDNLLDNYFGYHIGLKLFADICDENGYHQVVQDLQMQLKSASTSIPEKWMKTNEIFRIFGRVRFNDEALKTYGRFLKND